MIYTSLWSVFLIPLSDVIAMNGNCFLSVVSDACDMGIDLTVFTWISLDLMPKPSLEDTKHPIRFGCYDGYQWNHAMWFYYYRQVWSVGTLSDRPGRAN